MVATGDLTPALNAAGFDLDDAKDRQRLARIVGCQSEDQHTLLERLKQIQTLALTEWLEWASASRRFNSLSELDTDRVLGLFVTVRQAPPSVELLVEELAIPQGRAISMLGRMKYGKARVLTRMSYLQAERDVRQRLASRSAVDNSKTIIVGRDILERIRDVETDILLADESAFPSKETVRVDPAGRGGGIVTTSIPMWDYIIAELTKKAQQP